MNNAIQKGWRIAIIGFIFAVVIQIMLIRESYLYEKSVFVTNVNSQIVKSIMELNGNAQMTSSRECLNMISNNPAKETMLIIKNGVPSTFKIDKQSDKSSLTNQATYDLRDIDKWSLKRLDSTFQQKLDEEKLYTSVKFVLADSAGREIERCAGSNDSWWDVKTEPIHLGFIDRHTLQVNYEFPFGYYWQLAAERLKIAGFFFIVLLFCVYLLLQMIKNERKIRKHKEKLVHSLVHNLKNPVMASLAAIEAAERAMLPAERAGKVEEVFTGLTKRMTSLKYYIDELLTTEANANGFQVNLQRVDIERLSDDLVEFYEPLCTEGKNAVFRIENHLQAKHLIADYNHLFGVLSNLISNALKYSDKEVEIIILFRNEGNNVIITVKDNGIGMSKESQKRIFEPNYRVTSNPGGCGIGLYYVRMVVCGHYGKIRVKSEEGKGTEFIISLPQRKRWWNFKKYL